MVPPSKLYKRAFGNQHLRADLAHNHLLLRDQVVKLAHRNRQQIGCFAFAIKNFLRWGCDGVFHAHRLAIARICENTDKEKNSGQNSLFTFPSLHVIMCPSLRRDRRVKLNLMRRRYPNDTTRLCCLIFRQHCRKERQLPAENPQYISIHI